MSPQRRIALVSVAAAAGLIVIKLVAGLLTGSLGLLSEAAHSGVDLGAAGLTFFAVGVATRPADRGHAYGHGKAEHLTALAEAVFLASVSVLIVVLSVSRLTGNEHPEVDAAWWALLTIGVVIAIDTSRSVVSFRAAKRFESEAMRANALHFASDLAGSLAVLVGLLGVRSGYAGSDSIAALVVATLVLLAAGKLGRRNVDVLMDRAPAGAEALVRRAIRELEPAVDLRRLRMRQAAGRHFADVVIRVSPGAGVAQGHAAADAVEEAVERALPGSDIVVHVEPGGPEAELRERALAGALSVPQVREVHNVTILTVGDKIDVSLHLKLPGELPLDEAHAVANRVEAAIQQVAPEVDTVQIHLEPLGEAGEGRWPSPDDIAREREEVLHIVRAALGREPRELRFLATDAGYVAFLTLGLDPASSLEAAHLHASEIEARIRRERSSIADVIVHTEP